MRTRLSLGQENGRTMARRHNRAKIGSSAMESRRRQCFPGLAPAAALAANRPLG
jgi:hypothetical protein